MSNVSTPSSTSDGIGKEVKGQTNNIQRLNNAPQVAGVKESRKTHELAGGTASLRRSQFGSGDPK